MRKAFFLIIFFYLTLPCSFANVQIETYRDIELFIKQNPKSTADQFLNKLSARLKKNYAIVYRGRGLLGASTENPAIILAPNLELKYFQTPSLEQVKTLEKSEALWFAFRNDSYGENSNLIDLLMWNPTTKKTELKQLVFIANRKSKNQKAHILNEPVSCQSCHRSDSNSNARALWDSYPSWPGAVGSYHRLSHNQPWLDLSGNEPFLDSLRHNELKLLKDYIGSTKSGRIQILETQEIANYLKLPEEDDLTRGEYVNDTFSEKNNALTTIATAFNYVGAKNAMVKSIKANCEKYDIGKIKNILQIQRPELRETIYRYKDGLELYFNALEESPDNLHLLGKSFYGDMDGNTQFAKSYTKNHLYDDFIHSYDSLDTSGSLTKKFVNEFNKDSPVHLNAFVRQMSWNYTYSRMTYAWKAVTALMLLNQNLDNLEITMAPSRLFTLDSEIIEDLLNSSNCVP